MKDKSNGNQPILEKLQVKEFPQPDVVQIKYPVLFCHGFGALASILKPSLLHDPCMLARRHGVVAFAPNVVPYARIETRAESWMGIIKKLSEQYGYEKFNIVAHSMGGLDMRHALSHLGAASYVESMTTVATPHHGAYLSELILKTPEPIKEKLSELFDWFGNRVYPDGGSDARGSAEQLTRAYMENEFNPNNPNVEGLEYYSYSCAVGKGTEHPLNPIYLVQNTLIYDEEGQNDTFVSIDSAKWGKHLGIGYISHLEQINVQVNRTRKKLYQDFWVGVLKNLQQNGH